MKVIVSKKLLGRVVAVAAVTVGTFAFVVSGGTANATTLRDSIVAIAQRELGDNSRNFEANANGTAGSTNCTYYSGQIEPGWPSCGPYAGWRGGSASNDDTYAWCANFARYVWREGGVTYRAGLTAYAASFQTYGRNNSTWHARTSGYLPQPGDAIVFDWLKDGVQDGVIDHVGIVTSYSGGTVSTIEGNSSNMVRAHSYSTSNVQIVGYTEPVGAGTNVPGPTVAQPIQGSHSPTGPAVVRYKMGSRTDTAVFGRAPDGSVYESYYDGSTWTGRSLGGDIQGEPTVLANADGSLNVFVWATSGGGLWEKYWTPTGGWTPDWISLGGPIASAPSVIQLADTSVNVYARSTTGTLTERYYVNGYGWSPWIDLGGTIIGEPAALANTDGSVDVFIHAPGDVLMEKYWTPGPAWTNWFPLGGSLAGSPVVAQLTTGNAAGSVEVYARSTAGTVSEIYYASGTGWSAWNDLGGSISGDPAVLANSDASVDVFVHDAGDHSLKERYWTWTEGWSGWLSLSGALTTSPTVTQQADNSVDVFAGTGAAGLSEIYYTNGWTSWCTIGSPIT